jgi:hypothetical protein
MMTSHDLRDAEEAQVILQQSLWLQRVQAPSAASVRPALQWSLELLSSGQPLPPIGFVADVGHAALETDWLSPENRELPSLPGLPPGLARSYEDHVLGKFYADWTFARASDVLRRDRGMTQERNQARGLAFVLTRFCARVDIAGLVLSPGIIKGLLEQAPQDVLAQGWNALSRDGLHPVLAELYQSLIAAVRQMAEVLAIEDVFELEQGIALAEFGERVALRQVLQAAARLETTLPPCSFRPPTRHRETPTRILDVDTYPVGGFAALSTRGTIESLLHSQLAFMEKDERPDLFDIKYVRDELLYYARDENEFLRRRRTFIVVLHPDLVHTRVKDPVLPYQRGVLLLALLLVVVRQLSEWLSTDALLFEFLFLAEDEGEPLVRERELLQMLLREQIESGLVVIQTIRSAEALTGDCALRARRSLCHCLMVSIRDCPFEAPDTVVTRLSLDGPYPALAAGTDSPVSPEGEEPLNIWSAALLKLLERWISESHIAD